MSDVIETRNLSRRFGKKEAVHDLTIRVPEGSIFAFLGPNGAGKSTTIKLLMNILEPTDGEATVLGTNARKLSPAEFRQIGYVSEDLEVPGWMTVQQFLDYVRPMYPTWDERFCGELLKQFDLPLDRKLKHLSRGMRMKATLLSSLAYRPRLLVLDEPFTGLDPLVRDDFIRGVLELTQQEKWTVFVSSHDIDEVERLADWVGIINEGRLMECESTESMQRRFRQVQFAMKDEKGLPKKLPSSWLLTENEGRAVRFVESRYQEGVSEAATRELFPSCSEIGAAPMSLREIFIALAKTYRFAMKEERS
ncbi:MAG: ABC transporter ATP-binding protein [Planctomycetota bacterium]